MRARRWYVALVPALAAVVIGCGSDPYDGRDGLPPPTSAVTRPPSPRPPVYVQALDNVFRQRDIVIPPGTEVVWTNVGRNEHDVVPSEFEKSPEEAPWGVPSESFAPQSTYSHVFVTPGVYRYVCTIHGARDKGMAGTITVTG